MIGTSIGAYRITAKLGAGGMGEVYRARDTKLDREVAIKVLPAALAQDPERLSRFEREAKVLASLNHPNIAQIYGIEESNGFRALVMELVPGTTLKGPLPLETALNYAKQIADALEAAHEKGITHRDLKPANVMVTPAGVIKVLDFGLAAVNSASAPGIGDPTKSPTLTIGGTQAGMIMGTAGYMSPEQASGGTVDKRSDIWAFGVVLWEMLTGKQLFQGTTISHILASVLKDEPDFTQVPPRVRRLLRRCLEKDPRNRLRDIGDAMELVEVGAEATPAAKASPPSRLGKVWFIVAALSALMAGAVAFVHFREKPPEMPLLRTTILPPEKTAFEFNSNRGLLAVSPNGRRLVFAASGDGKSQLWVRPLDALTAQPLPGTAGAMLPFWSPDSRFVGFFADGKLKRIDISGGPPQTLADAPAGRGGTWSADGVIVFTPTNASPLLRVSAAGGTSSPVTKVDEGGSSHRAPWFLPDGRHFLYERSGGTASHITIHVGSLDSQVDQAVGEADSNALYFDGHLLFLRQNTLMTQPFDTNRRATTGDAVPIAEDIQHTFNPGAVGCFSVSSAGLLAYQTGTAGGDVQLTWFDRKGKPLGTLGEPANIGDIEFSPDRKSLATRNSDMDLWIYDVARGIRSRFTFGPHAGSYVVWSPDGGTVIFNSNRKGPYDMYRKTSDGAGAEELLYADNFAKNPTSWSPDGKFLLYSVSAPKTGLDLWVLPMTGEPKPFPFLRTDFNETSGRFSPDGRWVAYQSEESQRFEVYVAPFPGPGGKRQISTGGGSFPRWRQDGREIFYVDPGARLMAAEVNVKGGALEVGAVRPLFGPIQTGYFYLYDVSADGQRILAAVASQQASEPVTLVQNWTAALKK